jgi:hypothetical protein
MDANLITALAGVLGSLSGASAAIATTWISQKSQTIRERAKSETRKRETLYGEFITEASQQLANAFDHSLDKPETLVKLYAILGRIRLVSSDAVLSAAEECCDRVVDLYAKPNRTVAEIFATLQWRVRSFEALQRRLSRRAAQVFHLLTRRVSLSAFQVLRRGKSIYARQSLPHRLDDILHILAECASWRGAEKFS